MCRESFSLIILLSYLFVYFSNIYWILTMIQEMSTHWRYTSEQDKAILSTAFAFCLRKWIIIIVKEKYTNKQLVPWTQHQSYQELPRKWQELGQRDVSIVYVTLDKYWELTGCQALHKYIDVWPSWIGPYYPPRDSGLLIYRNKCEADGYPSVFQI